MVDMQTLLTCFAFLAVALLYASTGQAGASGYIAIMALAGYEPASIKPTALVLNILVSLVVSWRFIRDRHFDWQSHPYPRCSSCAIRSALAGNWSATNHLPHGIGRLALMVVMGSWLGAQLGSRWLSTRQIRSLLGVVLIAASLKLLLPI